MRLRELLDRAPALLRSASMYGVSNVVQRAIPFLLLPVLTRYLTKADLGMVALFMAAVNVATPLVGMNITYAIQRKFVDLEESELSSYVGSCVRILGVGLIACTALALLLRDFLASLTGLPPLWIILAVVQAGGQVLILVPLTLWQARLESGRFARVQIGRSALQAVLTLVFVIPFETGWQGALSAMVVTNIVYMFIVSAASMRTWIHSHSRVHLQHALSYGGSLLPHALGGMLITGLDRFFIQHYSGGSETGLYFVGYQFGVAVSLVADAFNRAWSPWLYATLKGQGGPEQERRVVRAAYSSFLGFLSMALAISIAAPFVVKYVLSPEVAGAERFVPWVAAGFAFNGMYRILSGFMFYSQRTLVLSAITLFAVILNAGLNAILVPSQGAIGAAQAVALAFLASFVLTWIAAQRSHPMPWLSALKRSSEAAS